MTHGKRNWAEVEAVELPAPLPAILDDLDDTPHYALRRHIVELMWEIESLNEKDLLQHTILAGLHDRVDQMEVEIKAAEAWKAEARELLGTIGVASLRLGSWVKCSDWLLRRDALLAQEGGDNG